MLFQGLGKSRDESLTGLPERKSLSAADRATALITIAVIAALGALLVARVMVPEVAPGPGQLVTLAFIVLAALYLVRLPAIHRK